MGFLQVGSAARLCVAICANTRRCVGDDSYWLLLMMSIALHVARCCVYDSDDESDEESENEKSTMYT